MLYDPNWQKPEVKADPFSLESLIAWLEKQPVDTAYCWSNPRDCLIGQWLHDITGLAGSELGWKSCEIGAKDRPIGRVAYPACDDGTFNYTFGAALDRARAALASRVHDGAKL